MNPDHCLGNRESGGIHWVTDVQDDRAWPLWSCWIRKEGEEFLSSDMIPLSLNTQPKLSPHLVSEACYQSLYGSPRAPEATSSSSSNPASLLQAATDTSTVSGHGFSSLMRRVPSFVFRVPYKVRALC